MIALLRSTRWDRPDTWLPAALLVLVGSTALAGMLGAYALLGGQFRGLATLLVPVFLVWWAWEARHDWPRGELDPMVQLFAGSWLVGAGVGALFWLLLQA